MDTNGTACTPPLQYKLLFENVYRQYRSQNAHDNWGKQWLEGRKMLDSSVWMNLCSLSLIQLHVLSVQCAWLCNTLKTETNDTPDEKNGKKK